VKTRPRPEHEITDMKRQGRNSREFNSQLRRRKGGREPEKSIQTRSKALGASGAKEVPKTTRACEA